MKKLFSRDAAKQREQQRKRRMKELLFLSRKLDIPRDICDKAFKQGDTDDNIYLHMLFNIASSI